MAFRRYDNCGATAVPLCSHERHCLPGSIPERDGSSIFNTSVVVNSSGEVVAKHRKVHLFDIDVPGKIRFMESDTLTAGDAYTVVDTPFCKIGVAICYDMRFPLLSGLMRGQPRGCMWLGGGGALRWHTGTNPTPIVVFVFVAQPLGLRCWCSLVHSTPPQVLCTGNYCSVLGLSTINVGWLVCHLPETPTLTTRYGARGGSRCNTD